MSKKSPSQSWPPHDGVAFIRSETFGKYLVDLANGLSQSYPSMDFTDAVAQTFTWFDKTLSRNRRYLNRRRFPTLSAFKSYLRQSLWNAARLAERERQRREEIESLPIHATMMLDRAARREFLDRQLALVQGLPEPHKTVLERYLFEREDPSMIASILDITESKFHLLYEEALDMLASE